MQNNKKHEKLKEKKMVLWNLIWKEAMTKNMY